MLGRDGEQILGMGTDDFGFSTLAGGSKPPPGTILPEFYMEFTGIMTVGGWWAPRDDDAGLRRVRTVEYSPSGVMEREAGNYMELWSVHC
jgi:hypothetical protein